VWRATALAPSGEALRPFEPAARCSSDGVVLTFATQESRSGRTIHALAGFAGPNNSFPPSIDKATTTMLLATSYPFLEVLWTMLIFMALVIWFYLLIVVFADIFRRHDESGWVKVLWIIFIVVLPYFGVFVYLIAENAGMSERALERR